MVIRGLGPGGATLAWALASRGITVIGYDIARSYKKACGDATPARASSGRLAEYVNVVIDDVTDFRILVEGREVNQVASRSPIWLILDKTSFVSAMREAAESEGAILSYGRQPPAGGKFEVDARGPYSRLGEKGQILVYRVVARAPRWPRSTALLDFRVKDAGLYWVFPAGDGRVNAGAGFMKGPQSISRLRSATMGYLDMLIGSYETLDERAAPLTPLREPQLYSDSSFNIGEAAGLVNALSGEGIRQAVESALRLAEAIHACGFHGSCSRRRYRTYARGLALEASISKLILRAVLKSPPKSASTTLESLPNGFWRDFLRGKMGPAIARAAFKPSSAIRAIALLFRLIR